MTAKMREALEVAREYLHHHRMTLPERGPVRLQRVLDAVDKALDSEQQGPAEPFNADDHLRAVLGVSVPHKPRPLPRGRT